MEIVTYVRTGAITHQDSLGNTGPHRAGDVQVMSAGTGVTHADTISRTSRRPCSRSGSRPTSRARSRAGARCRSRRDSRRGASSCSPAAIPADGTLTINADARVLGATLEAGQSIAIDAEPDRHFT
jgi:hypothetical protein